jgi:hypothetical protein
MRKLPYLYALAAAVALGACGGGGGSAPDTPEAAAAVQTAEQSSDELIVTDNPLTTQVLNVTNGSTVTLETVVDGDRPVLVWFWAPH